MPALAAQWPIKAGLDRIEAMSKKVYASARRASVGLVMPFCNEGFPDLIGDGESEKWDALAGIPWHHVNLYLYKLPHCNAADRPEFEWFRKVDVIEVDAKAEEWEVKRYLTHIVRNYDRMDDFTFFLHPDALEHVYYRTLRNLMQTLLFGVLEISGTVDDDWHGFFSLANHYLRNSSRVTMPHLDCAQSPSLHWLKARLGIEHAVPDGFYCCSQFVVHKTRILARPKEWYHDAANNIAWDHCLTSYMEILWQLIFLGHGELRRQEDTSMPLFLRVDNFYETATENEV
eukprot:GEMP01062497.1.p1 GENE.GEMP01062497.1~~GEMP01062497.1.p1  ORF type:complete len:287 (+),score=63.43 GEMP01062497.1:418-1278(+)